MKYPQAIAAESQGRATAACKRCTRVRAVHGRGLCHNCYKTATNNGTLLKYNPTGKRGDSLERNKGILARLLQGDAHRAIAADYGVSADTVRSVALRNNLRRRDSDGKHILAPMPEAPGRAPCYGATMYPRDSVPADQLHPARNATIRAGLELCATCPLAMRQHCLDIMQPQGDGKEWQGIAGGLVWSFGRVVYDATAAAVAS